MIAAIWVFWFPLHFTVNFKWLLKSIQNSSVYNYLIPVFFPPSKFLSSSVLHTNQFPSRDTEVHFLWGCSFYSLKHWRWIIQKFLRLCKKKSLFRQVHVYDVGKATCLTAGECLWRAIKFLLQTQTAPHNCLCCFSSLTAHILRILKQ